MDAALHVPVVGQRPDHRHLAGPPRRDAAGDELAGVDEQPRADALGQAVLLQVAHLLAQLGQRLGHLPRHPRLVLHDPGLHLPRRVVELDGHEALAGAVLQVLEGALVARVVGDDQQEAVAGLHHLPQLLDGQDAAVVGQGVDEDGGVLACLDDLVQVADGPGLDGAGEGAVYPAGGLPLQQVAAHQVGGRQVLVAGHRHQGQAGAGAFLPRHVADDGHRPAQAVGHVFHEAGLAAAGGPLQQHRYLLLVGGREQLHLVRHREVEGLLLQHVFLDGILAVGEALLFHALVHLPSGARRAIRRAHSCSTCSRVLARSVSVLMTTCARRTRSSLDIWARTRARASSRLMPLRSAARRAATSGGQTVTHTSSTRSSQPASSSRAASTTATRVPWEASSRSRWRMPSRMRG